MKKYFLLFLIFFSCSCGPRDDEEYYGYFLNEHYIIIDIDNTSCGDNYEFYWAGQKLSFENKVECLGNKSMMPCPNFKTANIFPDCIDIGSEVEVSNCIYINRPFILHNCRLLIDVDALNANPNSDPNEFYYQTHGQPNEDFYVNLQISNLSTETQQTVDATFLPVIFGDYENCRSTGYEENDYNELYQCFDSLPAHHSLSF